MNVTSRLFVFIFPVVYETLSVTDSRFSVWLQTDTVDMMLVYVFE